MIEINKSDLEEGGKKKENMKLVSVIKQIMNDINSIN